MPAVIGPALVTGATGLLGTALMAALAEAGVPATGVSSRDADLRDPAATEALLARLRPVVVFHAAGWVAGIMGNAGRHGDAYRDNIRINTNVVDAARLAGVRKVVAVGSTAIYADAAPLPKREADVWAGPPHPSEGGYSHAKRAMLAQLEAYGAQWGLDWAYCICTNLFGPHDRFDEQGGHVIPSLISKFHRAARDGGTVTVWGSGTPRRDFLYVADAARAMLAVAAGFSGPINLASGREVSIRETVALVAELSGFEGHIDWDQTKPDGQALRAYDVTRLQSLGFTPRRTLREDLAETIAWYAANVASARR